MEEEKKQETNVLDKTKEEVERIIKQITENGLQTANVELLYKLIDVHKDIENEKYWKEKENMYRGRDYFMDDSYNGGRSRDSHGRYMDGVLLPGTTVIADIATAGNYVNVAFTKTVPICCRGDATLTVQSVPSILTGTTVAGTPTDTQIPLYQNANFRISKR